MGNGQWAMDNGQLNIKSPNKQKKIVSLQNISKKNEIFNNYCQL